MTITPTGATPAPATSVAGVPATGTLDSGFADLVRQHLQSGSDGSSEGSSDGSSQESAGGLLTTEQAVALLEAASAPSAVPSEGLAALLAGLLAVSTATQAAASTVSTEAQTAATAPATPVGSGPASGGTAPGAVLPGALPLSPGTATVGIGSPSAVRDGLPGGATPGVNVPGEPAAPTTRDAPTQPAAAPATQTGQPAGATHAEALLDDARAADKASAARVSGDAPPADTGAARASADSALATVAQPAPTATSASAGSTGLVGSGAEGSTSHPVTDQVFGQVTRLVSRGDGTHRLTLRLHPADLGEVKVVLTVKDGAVDVSLSAGPAAREALRDGSPQLRALLELAGATTAQVVVRDAAGNAVPAGAGGQQATGHHASGQQASGSGAGDAQDQGGDLASRDGLADGSADGRGDADNSAATAAGISGPGALAGVRLRAGGTATPSASTGPVTAGTPARIDLNL